MSRRPYFKFYFEDFLNGCRKAALSPEEVGFYVLSLGFIWQDEGRMSSDPQRLGIATGWGTKICRRLTAQLEAKRKLIPAGDGYLTNSRMEREIVAFVNVKKAAEAREERRREIDTNRLRIQFEPVSKPVSNEIKTVSAADFVNKINHTVSTDATENEHKPESRSQKPEEIASAIGSQRPSNKAEWDAFEDRLLGACNGALAPADKRIGMSTLTIPLGWLEAGADLDKDVMPALLAVGKRAHGKNVKSWSYFTDAVMEAKANRLNPQASKRAQKLSQQERFRKAAALAAGDDNA